MADGIMVGMSDVAAFAVDCSIGTNGAKEPCCSWLPVLLLL